eukprot:365948-Chlamydomonas_euryale.AAC.16
MRVARGGRYVNEGLRRVHDVLTGCRVGIPLPIVPLPIVPFPIVPPPNRTPPNRSPSQSDPSQSDAAAKLMCWRQSLSLLPGKLEVVPRHWRQLQKELLERVDLHAAFALVSDPSEHAGPADMPAAWPLTCVGGKRPWSNQQRMQADPGPAAACTHAPC